MALPSNLVPGIVPTEAEYIATSDVEVKIVPLMRMDRVRLLDGVYGPLRPPTQARVPLWLALNLKRRKRCSIVCPEWMQLEQLKQLHREETMHDGFAALPLHYVAVSKVLLQSAPDDVPNSDEVRSLLKSIREARQSKIMSGVEAINTEHLAMTNISHGEITELRRFLGTAFDHLRAIQRAGEPEAAAAEADTDERQFSFSLVDQAQDSALPNSSNYQTPNVQRTLPTSSSTATPAWTLPKNASETPSSNENGAHEEGANNMDLF